MSRHRYEFKRAWWQKQRHARHLWETLKLWIQDQRTELKDIRDDLKERTK